MGLIAMFNFLKPKPSKRPEFLDVDTGEGRGSYGELLEQPKSESICVSGYYTSQDQWASGIKYPLFFTGALNSNSVTKFGKPLTDEEIRATIG
jgi:hypothetical protein